MRYLLLALGLLAVSAAATPLDLDLYAQLLEKHTRAVPDIGGTRVDYSAVSRDPAWRRLSESLEASEVDDLVGEEKLAFWINAYNILAIDLVARSYPVGSIKELGSLLRPVWKRKAGTIDGREVTLDEIEHRILRPLGDPRIHGAIVCASLSCPPLRREPYRAESLDVQLDDNTRRWLADPRKGVAVGPGTRTLLVSSIFEWFAEDFEAEGGVLAFVERFGPDEARALVREGGVRIRHLDYDWSLNDLAASPGVSRRGGAEMGDRPAGWVPISAADGARGGTSGPAALVERRERRPGRSAG
jgi:hypothetical protein